MSNELARIEPQRSLNLDETFRVGKVLAASGYFADARQEAQAVAKILLGQELGIPAMTAMLSIHIVQNKPTISAGLMAKAVKASTKYDYRVIEHDDTVCELAFLENGEQVGTERFTLEDARRAGTQNINKFPRNMLFARCISNGVRFYCPDVFTATVYVPEEMGASVDIQGNVIAMPQQGTDDVQEAEVVPPAPPTVVLASDDEIARYNALVDEVTTRGKLKDGKVPHKHAAPGVSQKDLYHRRRALQEWLTAKKAKLQEAKEQEIAEEIGEAGWEESANEHAPQTLSEAVHQKVAGATVDPDPADTEAVFGQSEEEAETLTSIDLLLQHAAQHGFDHGGDLSNAEFIEAINAANIKSLKGPIATLEGLSDSQCRVITAQLELNRIKPLAVAA